MELTHIIVEVAKALGGSCKLVTLAPRTVREMTQLLRGVFLANHLANNDNLTRTTKRQNTYNENKQYIKRGPNKQHHNRNMLRYDRQTKPGLVALYDIHPGNGSGPFLQPGAHTGPYEYGTTGQVIRHTEMWQKPTEHAAGSVCYRNMLIVTKSVIKVYLCGGKTQTQNPGLSPA